LHTGLHPNDLLADSDQKAWPRSKRDLSASRRPSTRVGCPSTRHARRKSLIMVLDPVVSSARCWRRSSLTYRRHLLKIARPSWSVWRVSLHSATLCLPLPELLHGAWNEIPSMHTVSLTSFAHRPATFETFLKLLMLPRALAGGSGAADEEEITVVDLEETGYQASFSKLGASEPPRRDPVADVNDPGTFMAQSLATCSASRPGVVGRPFLLQLSYKTDTTHCRSAHFCKPFPRTWPSTSTAS